MTSHTFGARGGRMLVFGAMLTGCYAVTGFTPSSPLRLAPRAEGCHLDLVFDGKPPHPYVVIGRVTTDARAPGIYAIGEDDEAALERMREEACRVGAHGLLHPGATFDDDWTRNGQVRTSRGAAVAFVYVDAEGRPLPPPRGPTLVIQPGGSPPPVNPPLAPAPSYTRPPPAAAVRAAPAPLPTAPSPAPAPLAE